MSRFVKPESTVLKLSDGDTLTVKRRLNAGEQWETLDRVAIMGDDGTRRIDRGKFALSLVLAYLLDWTLTDDNGNLVEIRDQTPDAVASILKALDPESFTEIAEAINAHDTAARDERERRKNSKDGATTSPAISPSLDSMAGATSG